VTVARVYDDLSSSPGKKVLVDRLWPRGLARATAPVDLWSKDVAPSTALRRWYGHVPERFEEFRRRYLEELSHGPGRDAAEELRRLARTEPLILLTATREIERSGAAVLQPVIAAH
jgi:uncharacterized protein YeaO (DUF488 family)